MLGNASPSGTDLRCPHGIAAQWAAAMKAVARFDARRARLRRCHRFNKELQRDLEYGRRG